MSYDLIKPGNIRDALRRVGIFEYDLKYEGDKVDIKFKPPVAADYIPLTFFVTEKKYHEADAYSPTGCVEGCSHPDCKKATK